MNQQKIEKTQEMWKNDLSIQKYLAILNNPGIHIKNGQYDDDYKNSIKAISYILTSEENCKNIPFDLCTDAVINFPYRYKCPSCSRIFRQRELLNPRLIEECPECKQKLAFSNEIYCELQGYSKARKYIWKFVDVYSNLINQSAKKYIKSKKAWDNFIKDQKAINEFINDKYGIDISDQF